MKHYTVEFTKEALCQLKKLDRYTSMLVLAWIRKNLEGCTDPHQHGKVLTANRHEQWCYHIGDYRLLADIQDSKILILILNIGHHHDIFDQ